MRIIDKNTDFYDYLQNVYPDKSITFDRRDSFLVTKQMMCDKLYGYRYSRHNKKYYILLQVCNTFWLFRATVTKTDEYNENPLDYYMEFVATWKNYNKERYLIHLDVIFLNWFVRDPFNEKSKMLCEYDEREFNKKASVLIEAVNANNYEIHQSIDKYTITNGDGTQIEKHIPLLKACGVASYINTLDIFLAFEEYFSAEKTSSERTESIGLTDKEKIENHGFSNKTSFRGK